MSLFTNPVSVGLLLLSFTSVNAVACPQNLKSLTDRQGSLLDLCSLSDRYHDAALSLKSQGVSNPEKIAGIYGPRFINFSTWQEKAPALNYEPAPIYQPAPTTWKYWSKGADWVQAEADRNVYSSEIRNISMDWLTTLHKVAMNKLLEGGAGYLRRGNIIGMTFRTKQAITEPQVKNILNIEYPKVDRSGPLLKWTATMCYEEQSEDYKKQNPIDNVSFLYKDWPEQDSSKFFLAADGQRRQCGYITYSSKEEFENQLKLWIKFVNQSVNELVKEDNTLDPIAVAAKAQRWFVATHPFIDGNGRMSRYVMDYIFKSLGLPAPILKDMDNDMYFSETEWAQEVAKGLEYTVSFMEMCAKDVKAGGCNVVQ